MGSKRKPKLGQNFLVDERAQQAIVDALGDVSRRTVIEIGPGRGAITRLLAGRCGRLVLVELDRAFAAELRFRFREQPTVEIVEGNVLAVDLAGMAPTGETLDVVGNLPYYITSDILLKLFGVAKRGLLRRGVLMMQREVAERVAATPGGREYALLSATAQMHAGVEMLFSLPPEAFSPPPEVDSSVVRLEFAPRFEELGVEAEEFDRFLRSLFAQKRKTVRNNLRAAGWTAGRLEGRWPSGVAAEARAEGLSLEQTAGLFLSLHAPGGERAE